MTTENTGSQGLKAPIMMVFADPMCSWCYGFAPQLERLVDKYHQLIAMRPVMGGLRAGETMPMDENQRLEIRTHWNHVQKMSGQKFDFSFFERKKFVYDTAPACQGVDAVRRIEDMINPTLTADGEIIKTSEKAFEYLLALHKAFYADGKDISQPDVMADIASQCGIERQSFLDSYNAPETLKQTHFDFMMTRESKVKGFPTLILGDYVNGFQLVTQGYATFEELDEKISLYLMGAGLGSANSIN